MFLIRIIWNRDCIGHGMGTPHKQADTGGNPRDKDTITRAPESGEPSDRVKSDPDSSIFSGQKDDVRTAPESGDRQK